MDIEGSEFTVIPDILESHIDIDQICVEIHHRMLINKNSNKVTKIIGNSLLNKHLIKFIKLMKSYDYTCIAISDTYEEFTFLKLNNIQKGK